MKALKITESNRDKLPNGTIYYTSEIYNEIRKRPFNVVLAIIGSAGNSEASAATTWLISNFSPKICFLMGIAAGVKNKIQIGNIVLSERVVPYESAAIERKGKDVRTLPSPNIHRLPFPIEQDVMNYDPDEERLLKLFLEIEGKFPMVPLGKEDEYHKHVAIKVAPRPSTIASGEKLLRNPEILKTLRETVHRKIEVGEMEAAGFAEACRQAGVPWLVVRGISDFGDKFKSDDFHPFASSTAATVLADFIQHGLDLDYNSLDNKQPIATKSAPSHLKALSEEISDLIHPASGSTTVFDLRVSICQTYDHIFTENFIKKGLTPKEILDLHYRKLLLHAPGGSGKTAVMCGIAQEAINAKQPVFFLNFRNASNTKKLTEKEITNEYLFSFSHAGGIVDFQRFLSENSSILLLVDGLNETHSSASEKILKQFEGLIRENTNVRIIVADRMNPHPASLFFRGTIDPLSETEILRVLPDGVTMPSERPVRQLLSVPFFLDLQLKLWQNSQKSSPKPVLPRKEMFSKYFSDVAKISPTELKQLSEASYKAYEEFQTRTFTETWWNSNIPRLINQKLESAGVLLNVSSTGEKMKEFRHQLLHDYLTSRSIAENKERWGSELFDTATFKTNSYESISFAAELLQAAADEFLVKVYDWSYKTAVKCIIDLKQSLIISPVSKDLEIALTVKNAEKMLEVFEDTYKDSKISLLEWNTDEAETLLNAESEESIFEFVKDYEPSTDRFKKWKQFFLLETITEEDLFSLKDDDPIIGWTFANTLRRIPLSGEIQAQLRMMYKMADSADTLRWRIAHLLGRLPSKENFDLLLKIVSNDAYEWARYGAIRSLMEIASIPNSEFRELIISELLSKLPSIKSPLLLREIRRTCLVKDANRDWYDAVLRLASLASKLPEADSERAAWNSLFEEINAKSQVEGAEKNQ